MYTHPFFFRFFSHIDYQRTLGRAPYNSTTASPLDKATLTELKTVLENFLNKGQELKLEMKIGPSIPCGMIAHFGEKYVDMYSENKIQKLSRAM
uniref:Uncharacterized protein n=1 Tax=Sus scrofa TaxID=9823 RepID=A0A4X1TQ83_PIG